MADAATNPASTTTNALPGAVPTPAPSKVTHLSDADLKAVRVAIGAPPIPVESPISSRTTRKTPGIPDGLYKEVISFSSWSKISYYLTASLYNACLVLQLILGAALTALGSIPNKNATAITILAAANTVNAGIVALLHNSGLPTRLRNDWFEYDKVETYLVEMMDSGIVDVGMSRDDAIQNCFNMFTAAKATVQANKPSVYTNVSAPAVTKSSSAK